MERLGAWLWRRDPQRFVVNVMLLFGALLSVGVLTPATLVGSLYVGLTLGEFLLWSAATTAGLALAAIVIMASLRSFFLPLRRWVEGDRTDPSSTWLVLLRLPHVVAGRLLTIGAPLVLATNVPIVLTIARPDLVAGVALVGASLVVVAFGAVIIVTALQLVVRAPAADVSGGASVVDDIETGGWSLRFRLVAVVMTASASAGLVVPSLVLGGGADGSDHLIALLGSLLFAGYVGWVADAAVVQPTLRPLRDVMLGTVRIRRGDATEPVSVTTLDELGDLATAFNAMQRGLQERSRCR